MASLHGSLVEFLTDMGLWSSLFIETSVTVTITMLCISLIFFLVFFVSYTLFLTGGRNMAFYQHGLKCLGGACILISVFGAVILLVVVYSYRHIQLTDVRGILTGL